MAKVSRALKTKKDEGAKQLWIGIPPSAKQCKKCIYAYPDTEYTTGAEKANCEMYQPPEDKPPGVLKDDIDCEFFEEE